jgi:type III pantothenate kinase
MILCLDVGNSEIFGGVFENDGCVFHFRRSAASKGSSDEIGVFLRSVLRENEIDPGGITDVAICSVVPDLTHSLRNACLKYLKSEPFFLQAGVKSGLKLRVRNPHEVGADRIANSIAAVHRYPNRNILVVDYGTATTFEAVSADREYFGGVIIPGVRIGMEALFSRTAKLPSVEIVRPEGVLGRSSIESIQAGLYFGNVGAAKEIIAGLTRECFGGQTPTVVATGGFSRLFEGANLFDAILPDLVLEGLYHAWKMNR